MLQCCNEILYVTLVRRLVLLGHRGIQHTAGCHTEAAVQAYHHRVFLLKQRQATSDVGKYRLKKMEEKNAKLVATET